MCPFWHCPSARDIPEEIFKKLCVVRIYVNIMKFSLSFRLQKGSSFVNGGGKGLEFIRMGGEKTPNDPEISLMNNRDGTTPAGRPEVTVKCNVSLRTPSGISPLLLFEDLWMLQEEVYCGADLLQSVQHAAITEIFPMLFAAIPCTVCT